MFNKFNRVCNIQKLMLRLAGLGLVLDVVPFTIVFGASAYTVLVWFIAWVIVC